MKHNYLRLVPIAGAAAAALAMAATTVPSDPNKIGFPAAYDKGILYATVDRYDVKQYREFYTSAESVKAAREGKPLPYGTTLTLVPYKAKLDASGNPIKDANGHFVKDELVGIFVMEKRQGWGADIPADIRNGEWEYQVFTPEGKVNDTANLRSGRLRKPHVAHRLRYRALERLVGHHRRPHRARHPRPPRRADGTTPHRARPRPATMGGRQRRARAAPDPAQLPTPAFEFDQRLTW